MSNGNKIGLSTIANRYATALFELGEKHDKLDNFSDDLSLIASTLESNSELQLFLQHPTIPLFEKKDVIDKIFRNNINIEVLNVLKLLLDRNRLFIFDSFVKNYRQILYKQRNIAVAEVITAINIPQETINQIKNQLEKVLNQAIIVDSKIDPDIIAGMIIKVGDRFIDGSIRTRLENMKKQLM